MTFLPLNPPAIPAPLARYSHAVEIPPRSRVLRSSGQLGLRPDGTIPDGTGAQLAVIFHNITVILAEAAMQPRHICHITAWLVDRADLPAYMAARDAFLAGQTVPAASTVLLVAGFSRPEFTVEVEVMATAADGPA
ncbi:RidA family protein [Rhodobacteraceae bacterium HSP-20]|uniref:RidA family protein n=1 Tax=Paragemmobacter amnigenus TaxID=2852097 RepID=A0ABS6J9L1_9RHOB|nr:RidA family protein [Rhodobacter amnigenus]MBU9699946.1 RidA family protein [Rhodobacter amnigenus]MBV4391173.1 RidA family protein [Rhodobacter amnigenus]